MTRPGTESATGIATFKASAMGVTPMALNAAINDPDPVITRVLKERGAADLCGFFLDWRAVLLFAHETMQQLGDLKRAEV